MSAVISTPRKPTRRRPCCAQPKRAGTSVGRCPGPAGSLSCFPASGWWSAFGLPTGTEPGHSRALYWLALALTLAGSPYLAWALLRITLSGYDARTHRQRWAVFGIVAAVVLLGFVLGRLNPYFLTCADFTVSGNSQPPGCTPGPVTVR